MKNINPTYLLSVLLCCSVLLGCYEEENIVEEIVQPTEKGSYPVSANTLVDLLNGGNLSNNRTYTAGTDIRFELQYWCDDPIAEINLYNTVGALGPRQLTQSYADENAYSKLKSCDTLLIDYKLPGVPGTTVKLEVEIVNAHDLALTRTVTVKTAN